MPRLITIEDFTDVYVKLRQRGARFLLSKLSLDRKQRSVSAFAPRSRARRTGGRSRSSRSVGTASSRATRTPRSSNTPSSVISGA